MAEIKQQGISYSPTLNKNEGNASQAVSALSPAAPTVKQSSQALKSDSFTPATPDLSDKADKLAQKAQRTPGLKIFDTLVYPVFNNTSVFVTSVIATYLSINGDKKNSTNEYVFGSVGRWFRDRSIGTDQLFQSWFKMKPTTAKNSRIVLWSFVDGTLLSLPVKWMENKREHVAKSIDAMLGTQPADDTPYESEPKQTWLSVLGGRITTAAIVVSTALLFENTKVKNKAGQEVNINEKMFQGGADKIEGWIKSKPKLQAFFDKPKVKEKVDVNSLAYVGIFEAVYTSICTAGLYVISRFFARGLETTYGNRAHPILPKIETNPKRADSEVGKAIMAENIIKEEKISAEDALEKPSSKLRHIAEAERLERLPTQTVSV